MLTFKNTMDPDSLDVFRDDVRIGMAQAHRGRTPRLTVCNKADHYTLMELHQIIQELLRMPYRED